MQKFDCRKMFSHVAGTALPATIFAVLLVPAGAQVAQSGTPVDREPAVMASTSKPDAGELPDSPGVIAAAQQTSQQDAPASGQQYPASPPAPAATQSQAQSVQTQKPVGTAAADAPPTTGVAASQPAGAAIAPAKQKRVRTIVIRVGAIVAAGAAIGAVAALTAATPSKPPGTH